jgi:hypothetical protein
MAMDKSTYDKLSEEEKIELAKKYADRLLYALTEEGAVGGGVGTNEEEAANIAKELQKIGHSSLINLIDAEVRKKYPEGLRKVLIDDYSGDDEDAILNAFGYPTEDMYGESLQESQTEDPGISDYGKFGPGGTISSNEYDESESIVAEDGLGSGTLDDRNVNNDSKGPDIKKPQTLDDIDLPAPAPQNQAQAARPTLDQPDNGKSAFARAAANAEPDFINRLNGNARWANPVKAQLEQEAKRRLQNELAELKKSEKARKRAGEEDVILNTLNDQYRQLYANTPDAEGNARSAEDWDAMDRDQKIKMIRNYNINRSLGAPAGEMTGQKMNAQVAPRGSMEDLTTPREFNEVTKSFEVPQEPRQFNNVTNEFEVPQKPRQFNNVTNEFEVPQKPRQFNNQTNSFKIPQDYDKYFDNPDVPDVGNINKSKDYSQYFDNPDVPDVGNINKSKDYSQYFDNPDVPDVGNINKSKKEEGFLDKLKNFDLYDYVDDLQSQFNKPISPDELAKMRKAPPSLMDRFEPIRAKALKKFDDTMGPIYDGDPAALNKISRAIPDVFDMDNYEQAPKVIRAKNNTPQAPAPQAPAPQAPAPTAKLPAADPFLDDEPASKMQGPKEKMVPIYGSDGIVGYRSYSDQRKAAQDYAKKQMRESPFSSLGNANSGRMSKLYPTLDTDRLKKEVDQETADYYSKNNPFGSEFRPAPKEYLGPVEKSPTPRTTAMMRDYDAMPKRKQLDVINSFRRYRGEDEIYNPFS